MDKHNLVLRWKDDVDEHDFAAAENYLTLRNTAFGARVDVTKLHNAEITHARANDILRAARLEPAPLSDPGVLRDLAKVARGEKLSPVLLVNLPVGLDIADGYHRVSLSYHLDPFSDVPHRIAMP